MDKKIPTLLFILFCIVIPLVWFSLRFSFLAQEGIEKAQAGHSFLVSQLRSHIDDKGRLTPVSKTEVEFMLGLEREIMGLCMFKNGSSILVQTPAGFTQARAEELSRTPTRLLQRTDISPDYVIISVASIVSAEALRSSGFGTLLVFAGAFIVYILIILLIPAARNSSATRNLSDTQVHADASAKEPATASNSSTEPSISSTISAETKTAKTAQSSGNEVVRARGTLFEPETGLCWAEDLAPRLDEEIKRSASFENELVVIISTIDMDLYETDDFGIFVETVKSFFSFRDMVFRYSKDGVAIILQNMDIDHALRMCDELIKKISYLIQQNKNEMHYVEAFFGMSARSGRIIDSTRILQIGRAHV